ncbi:ABC transporter ATP-binding protein [uncultured Parabacteroides sp.]|uniref:ABC transporter ATP-binding protein n=1 Tax=uncultured Parabacteroides sp. TaxID=512312 RepID=UPI002607DC2B|nr:ABC transporter ATP-binding protein [uncultured Parabacteroides sp.]
MKRLILLGDWLWKVSRETRCGLLLCCLAVLLHAGFSMYFIHVCKILVDIATGRLLLDFHLYAWVMVFCVISLIILSVGKGYLSARNDIRIRNALRYGMFVRLSGMGYESRMRYHSGDILSRLTEDVRVTAYTLSRSFPAFVSSSARFTLAFAYLFYLDIRLAWIILTVLPVCLLLSKFSVREIRRLTFSIRQDDSKVQAFLQESFQHLFLLQVFERKEWMKKQLNILQENLYRWEMKRSRISVFSGLMVMCAFSGGYAVAFLWGVHGIYTGTVTFGMLTAFLQLIGQIQHPLADLGRQLPALVHATASIDRLRELEDDVVEMKFVPLHLSRRLGIRFRHVSFCYPGASRYILKQFNYDFRPGSRTAISGVTGTGKTTLFRLILSLLRPQEGEILLYDKEGREVQVSSSTLCNLIYVPQGNTLWSGTIRENLLLGNPDATEKDMYWALKTAVAEFVFELPEGLETLCAEQGGGLSEGQAQRIAIARALLRKGSIYLFDELSSSLDEKTEESLIQNIITNLPGSTMLFITHRRRIADYCDDMLTIG